MERGEGTQEVSFELHRDPIDETKNGLQDDRETHGPIHRNQPPPWNIGDRLNEFVLERLLGSGSSGFVYRAVEVGAIDQRPVALKLLRPIAPELLLLNKLGFRKMMTVEHPNLVRVHRMHQLGSYVALSMEEVQGETFAAARLKLLELAPHQAYLCLLDHLRQFASGLAAMHRRGLIHRDLKPANIMIRDDGVAKIIDYGLVTTFQLDQSDCKPRGFFLGTPRYIAPEVYWRQQYLPSGDIFCLGIVFLETLLSIQNHASKRASELHRSKDDRNEDLKLISQAIDGLQESVPEMILETCRQMLSRDPGDRPTAAELSRVGLQDANSTFIPSPRMFVGREQELRELKEWADRIFAGSTGRIHISGPSGIGKTCLMDQVIDYIESKKWGQVFFGKCCIREDQPLQAFDQICDAIADRYMQSDREPIQLDPVSTAILKKGFPVLTNSLESRMELAPPGTMSEAMDALEAAVRLSQQLRQVGPLFIVIDDAQWADVDSRNLLDRLSLADGGAGLGIITVSRQPDGHRQPAQQSMEIGSLNHEASGMLLKSLADRWRIALSEAALQRLVIAADGSPFRLHEFADELRSTERLSADGEVREAASLDQDAIDNLWRRRASRLSDDARRLLPYIATAGGRMSTSQLASLTGLNESVDAAVSELVQHNLISDQATGGQCIEVVHDRVADEMISLLSDQTKRQAHHAWAMQLSRELNPSRSEARIAGHFFAAGEPEYDLSHAILAAEDAVQRAAMHEAARMYRRIAKHVDGTERIRHLRHAANCFRDAEYPIESAKCFQELAALLDPHQRFECELTAFAMLIRAGRMSQVREQLREFATRMRIPKPKSELWAKWALLWQKLVPAIPAPKRLLDCLGDQEHLSVSQTDQLDRQIQQQLDLCFSLVRPLSMFDHLYAAELSIFGSKLLVRHRNTRFRIHAAVGQAVVGCCDRGRRREQSESQLEKLATIVLPLSDARCSGDVLAGLSTSHALAGRWNQVIDPAQQSVEHYRTSTNTFDFDITHTQWLGLWALWHLGKWRELRQQCLSMHEIGVRRNDGFQQFTAAAGYCSSAWLMQDEMDVLQRIEIANKKTIVSWEQFQVVDAIQGIGLTLRHIYQSRYDKAWHEHLCIKPNIRRTPFSKIQLLRVIHKKLGSIIALHQLSCRYSEPLVVRAKVTIADLRKERIPFATMLADLYAGLLWRQIAIARDNHAASLRSIRFLAAACDQAQAQQLLPFQLAASDALHALETGKSTSHFDGYMRDQGVVNPGCYRRLFTVDS